MIKKRVYVLLAFILLGVIIAICDVRWQQMKAEKTQESQGLVENDFSAAEQIETAMKKLEDNPEKPDIITDINTVDKKVAICFEGYTDRLIYNQIIEYLDAHDMTASFFISAVDVGEDEELIADIVGKGYDVESYTLYGNSHMEEQTQEELVTDFCRAQEVYKQFLEKSPSILKCNATKYTDELLEAAKASGYDSVLYSTHYINYSSFSSEEMAKNYVAGLDKGSIISIKVKGYLDENEYEDTKADEDPAKDKQPGIELNDLEEEELTDTERLLNTVSWLLAALDDNGYTTVPVKSLPSQDIGNMTLDYSEQEQDYVEEKAEVISTVHTTDRETAFTFRGLGNENEVKNLLKVLDETDSKATFFVTGKEIDNYADQVSMIIEAGHEIGNGGYTGKSMKDMTFAEICEEIRKNDIILEKMGIETDLFMAPYGVVTDEVRMAAAAMNKKLILYNSSPARTDYADTDYSMDTVVNKYYSKGRLVFCRGDITYFNMDVYDDDTSISELVEAVYRLKILPTKYGTRKDNVLQVCTVSQLLDNTWSYPASTGATSHQIENSGKMSLSLNEMIYSGYIGNPNVEIKDFSEDEEQYIDKTGRIDTGGTNTVFLTFDDWGNEATIGKILYVLKKHNIKASFFIKTEYVIDGSSENLLRAIAEDGHDIASHTNEHMQIDITQDQVSRLQSDLVKSNQILASVVGNTGRLTDYFRPPTLAINKLGINTIFDCGYGHIISGDVSTSDYDAASVDEMYDILLNGARLDDGERLQIEDGSIVVMHINTNAVYTAQGLDRYLNYIESLPDGDPKKFNFAKLSDYIP